MAEPALAYLLQRAHETIPKQLLSATFGPGGAGNYNTKDSIDRILIREVFEPVTLRQINQTCGKHKMIILQRAWRLSIDPVRDSSYYGTGFYAGVYKIPPHARDFGPITAVERIETRSSYAGMGYGGMGGASGNFGNYGNTVTNVSAAVLASRTLSPYDYNPRVILLDSQTIKVSPDDRIFSSDMQLQCQIGYDVEMTNVEPSMLDAATKLFICDLKIRIYNTLDIPTNEVEVTGGQEITRFKDRLSEYAEALNEREELVKNLKGSQYFDQEIFARMLRYSL